MVRLVMPVFFLIIGIIFLFATLNLPKAKLGEANAPLYFPGLVSIFLIALAIIYFIQEWRQRNIELKVFKEYFTNRTNRLVVLTLVLIIIYTLLFERIGFLYSTLIFLTGLLFVVNGHKKWLTNLIVSTAFSFISWYVFAELLKVSLP